MTDDGLLELSKDKLFLNLEEMGAVQNYFKRIGRDSTDAELEVFAQTWSEHCGHKTFKALLIVDGKEKEPLFDRIKRGVEKYGKGVLSAFVDNAGVIYFYDETGICFKIETHNSPSALDPYGGAITGIVGVFRDPKGTGKGAKLIASMDIFCFGDPNTPQSEVLSGCLHPNYLLRKVVDGVRDGANRVGVPTINGSVHFHKDFGPKPTVIVGACGIMPASEAKKGKPCVGDKIIAVGGRTGRDGIHGATFSSAEMTDRTISVNSTAVQIGNAIEEKRSSDALLACRDKGYIRAITDCGAGGFSSAIGEMASETGALVQLEKAPLKYPGLAPWEIWVSESQERMVVAVAPKDVTDFLKICEDFNVEATVLGEFTGEGKLFVTYKDEVVCDLEMGFLHNGLPQRVMKANWVRPKFEEPELPLPNDWVSIYERVLGHGNICSKEPIVRQYDHGVQGTSALPSFSGVNQDGPNDSAIITPILGKPYGLIISHGMNPILNRIDPYWGSIWAGVEALSNLVAVGGNPKEVWLSDNFIWPFPDKDSLGALDMAVDACVDIMDTFEIPFISGKDSLSSTYRGKDGTVVKIPPVLCISAFGKIPDVSKTITADLKKSESMLVLLGELNPGAMAGSAYFDLNGLLGFVGNCVPKVNLKLLPKIFKTLHKRIKGGKILSAHDISEGGVASALAEMCFGGGIGAEVDLSKLGQGRPDFLFFNEMAGCFLLEVGLNELESCLFLGLPYRVIGKTIEDQKIKVMVREERLFEVPIEELKKAWQKPMKEVFLS